MRSLRTPRIPDGSVFGKLTVKGMVKKNKHSYYECLCVCGNRTLAKTWALRSRHKLSCGCHHQNLLDNGLSRTHGESSGKGHKNGSPEYKVWLSMTQRCTNPNQEKYADYGGRGIKICDAWRNFENFLKDMGRRPTPEHEIDRTNNDGNYEPGNCRWVTRKEQTGNKRNNVYFTMNGKTQCLTWWAEEFDLNPDTVLGRYERGDRSPERLFRPSHKFRFLSIGEDKKTITEWAEVVGLSYETVRRRLKEGMSVEDALFTKSLRGKIKKNRKSN